MNSVGRIVQLARYPVKSMRGEALSTATLTLQGIPDDRRYAFVQTASRSDFPWLTARQFPELLLYTPAVEKPASGEVSIAVTTPAGDKRLVHSDELRRELEERSGRGLFLLRQERGSYDAAPVSIISRQTIARIAEESGTPENGWRFRPNIVVDLSQGAPFEELNWVGRILRVGDAARVAIIKVDQRCMIITLDPETAQSTPRILRCVVDQHAQYAGIYGTVLTPGGVRAGDIVRLET